MTPSDPVGGVLERLPDLPREMSSDGREVWDWADRFSRAVHARNERADLARRISALGTRCGDCRWWMTKTCPRERCGGLSGFSKGPSCAAVRCSGFSEKPSVTEHRASLQATLTALSRPQEPTDG